MLTSFVICDVIFFFLTRKCQKKSKKMITIVNVDGENLHIFWTAWGIATKFSEKMWFMIILLKVTKKPGLHLHSKRGILEKPQAWVELNPSYLKIKKATFSLIHWQKSKGKATYPLSSLFNLHSSQLKTY